MRRWRRAACCIALIAAGVFAKQASATLTSGFAGGTLTVTSDATDSIAIACAADNVRVNGADPGTGTVACAAVTQLSINGGPGANSIDIGAVTAVAFPNLTSRTVTANAGDDVITGSPSADVVNGGLGNDVFIGGDGDDTFTGGDGNDTALLAGGNDRIVWNPGDDNDTIEGQTGIDVLSFNGANVAEAIDIVPNGGRVLLLRNVGTVALDLNDVERLEFAALGGADTVAINDLSGTDLTQLRLDLRATGGGGDGAADLVTVNATNAADNIDFAASGPDAVLSVLPTTVTVVGPESANDSLLINALGGNDMLTAAIGATGLLRLTLDAGVSAGNGDLAVITGEALAETYTIGPIALAVRVGRTMPTAAGIDLIATERVQLDTLAGTDAVTTQFLATTSQSLSGGDPTTFPGDTLVVTGFSGDITASPLVQAGSGTIAHTQFEFGIFDGFLTGGQVVPPNASPGRGTVRIVLTPTGNAINLLMNFQGLTGINTQTHIHGPAVRGANAPGAPLFVLSNSGMTSGVVSAGPLAITPTQRAQIEAGLFYIDVHSATFPDGELRGQLDGIQFANGFEVP